MPDNKKVAKKAKKKKDKEKPTKLNMSFEDAIALSIKTKIHKKSNN